MDAWILLFGVLWLAGMNLAAWIGFARDKHAAVRGKRRVPERTLLALALFGGSPAALAAQRVLRHKTRKEPFRTWLLLIVAAQVVALAAGISWLAGWIG